MTEKEGQTNLGVKKIDRKRYAGADARIHDVVAIADILDRYRGDHRYNKVPGRS
jgi:hypothetical protein